MFGLSKETILLLDALAAVIGLIVLITRFRIHPFIALTIAAVFLGLISDMPVAQVIAVSLGTVAKRNPAALIRSRVPLLLPLARSVCTGR